MEAYGTKLHRRMTFTMLSQQSVAAMPATLLNKRQVFSCEDCKIFKNIFFIEPLHFKNNFIKKGL